MSSYRYSSRSAGLERALQHIEEAKQLTRELGGTDKDVKEYFFSLPTNELKASWTTTSPNTESRQENMRSVHGQNGGPGR